MLEFQCRADEYLEARRAALRVRSFESWLYRRWGPALLIAGLVVIAQAPMHQSGYLVTAVGVALVLNNTLWFRHRVRVEWRTTPSLAYRTWVEIRDTGLLFRTVDGEARVPWSSIKHIIETRATFVLYRASDDLRVFPKRAFANKSQIDSFRARLAAVCVEKGDGSAVPSFRFEVDTHGPRWRADEDTKRREGGIQR
jgi:hypothetical protein